MASKREFIGTKEYLEHKKARFPKPDYDIPVAENEAFLLTNKKLRSRFKERYEKTAALYYNGQPDFEEMLATIGKWVEKL